MLIVNFQVFFISKKPLRLTLICFATENHYFLLILRECDHLHLVQQICAVYGRIVPFTIKAWHLADRYSIPKGRFLDIGTSQICPMAEMAAI